MQAKVKFNLGFTLIEVLIVVVLLGALAVGLLTTINPFEQIKKGTDTARRNTTTAVYNAFLGYYAAKSTFPWTVDVNAMTLSDDAMALAPDGYLRQLIAAGELKAEFIEQAGTGTLSKIFVTSVADAIGIRQNIAVCYLPESKSFAFDANARYDSSGAAATGCLSSDPTGTACYWCIK